MFKGITIETGSPVTIHTVHDGREPWVWSVRVDGTEVARATECGVAGDVARAFGAWGTAS